MQEISPISLVMDKEYTWVQKDEQDVMLTLKQHTKSCKILQRGRYKNVH